MSTHTHTRKVSTYLPADEGEPTKEPIRVHLILAQSTGRLEPRKGRTRTEARKSIIERARSAVSGADHVEVGTKQEQSPSAAGSSAAGSSAAGSSAAGSGTAGSGAAGSSAAGSSATGSSRVSSAMRAVTRSHAARHTGSVHVGWL